MRTVVGLGGLGFNTTRTVDSPAKDRTDTRISPSVPCAHGHLQNGSAARRPRNPSCCRSLNPHHPPAYSHKPLVNPKSGEGGHVGFFGLICSSRFRICRIYNQLRTSDSFNVKVTEALLWDKRTPYFGLLPVCCTSFASVLFIVPCSITAVVSVNS